MPDSFPVHIETAAALPIGEFAAYIGLDWGDSKHAVALRPRNAGAPIEKLVLEHSAENLHAWLESLAQRFENQRIAIALEASKGAVVAALLEYPWLIIYPIHPATSHRFSKAFAPSGAKDDMPDAEILLTLLVHHRDRLRPLVPLEAQTRLLAMLVETRRHLVDERTKLTNQLTSVLKNYYPQALELAGTLTSSMALDFLSRWPELAVLQRARPETLRNFYYAHRVRRPELIEARLNLLKNARPLTGDAALRQVSILRVQAIIAQLRALNIHIDHVDEAVAATFKAHPDAELFRSLPGAGAAMAPRLCVLFGEDRDRWSSAQQLQKYYAIAPVMEKSGKQLWIHWRWSGPTFGRQSLIEWAGLSVQSCAWAKAYYLQQKQKQKGHHAILRSLAFKWLRILWRCWRDRKPYDDALYMGQLQKRNVPMLASLNKAA